MKTRFIAVFAFFIGLAVTSCINPDETMEAIFQRDLESIQKYLDENQITSVKKYEEPLEGVYIYWQESVSEDLNSIKRGDTVRVDYTGKLLTNVIFDTSKEQVARDNGIYAAGRLYQPLRYPLGLGFTISGFEFAISLMRPGEKATVIFPSRLGYGSQSENGIPANSPLIFEIDLLGITPGPNQ